MNKEIYFVHCVDTEGPLYESLDATFGRLKEIYGIDMEATKDNLYKLQTKAFDFGGIEDEVAKVLDNSLIKTLGNWDEIEQMLESALCSNFRNELLDTDGNGWVYNWYCLDHVGFNGDNPRRRIAGHHAIFDWYTKKLERPDNLRDLIQWHYHPLPFNGHYNACGMNYVSSSNIFEILSRKIIERNFFPASYRPGFHTERPDSHWFLEQWIPFDYSCQAMGKKEILNQKDLGGGRFGNWENAPALWQPYHPSHDDYQKVGTCHRWINRCLNINTRLRNITQADIDEAFYAANSGQKQLVAFTDHDFRNIAYDVNIVRNMIITAARKYSDVNFYFCNAIEGMRRVLDLEVNDIKLDLKYEEKNRKIIITSNNNIFGSQPFFCVKTYDGKYLWSNLDFIGDGKWSFIFDYHSVEIECVDKIGIAANSTSGITEIIVYDMRTSQMKKNILNV